MAKALQSTALVSVLLVIVVVQVLPQMDLPDIAFHGGTAPLVVKGRLMPNPMLTASTAVSTAVRSRLTRNSSKAHCEQSSLHAVPRVNFLPSLLCSLLC
jgi:hypothetical protein